MRKHVVLLLVVALTAAAFAPAADAARKKKKKKKKPVPVEVTYHINWGEDGCILSLTPVASEEACADPFAGILADQMGEAFPMPAVDGLPLTLDATKPIAGSIDVESYYLIGAGPDIMGIGQPEIEVKLTGVSKGEEVVLGELTTPPYTVTPASADYHVDFEIEPPAELDRAVLTELVLTMQIKGNSLFHGVFPADGESTLTLGSIVRK